MPKLNKRIRRLGARETKRPKTTKETGKKPTKETPGSALSLAKAWLDGILAHGVRTVGEG